jgi:hypothetical protein
MICLFNSLPALKFDFLPEKGGQEFAVDRDFASPLCFRRPAGFEHNLGHSALEINATLFEVRDLRRVCF